MGELQDIEHIFVGMDDRDLADSAIASAMHLGPVLGADVRVIHALHPSGWNAWAREEHSTAKLWAGELVKAREDRLTHLRSLADREQLDAPLDDMLSVRLGKPATTLIQLAESAEQSMIVLGPHRHAALFDFGGTTREVLSGATCPVLVQTGEWAPIRRVLAAVDLSAGSEVIVATAARMANLLSAELTVIHAFQTPLMAYDGLYPDDIIDQERKRVDDRFEEILQATVPPGARCERQLLSGLPSKAILDQQATCDLLVMGSHGHSMFERVMLGSEAHRVLKTAEKPVIVIPQRGTKRIEAPAKAAGGDST
jgi:nucleotide-binding universal stress UspA family protein